MRPLILYFPKKEGDSDHSSKSYLKWREKETVL
jgi:hypothetical protein